MARGKYKTTIKAREAEAQQFVALIKEVFEDYDGPILVEATVEGQPHPDKDMWTVRAEVLPDTYIVFKIAPENQDGDLPVLAMISRKTTGPTRQGGSNGWSSELRETLLGLEEAKAWISLAWMELNPNDPEVERFNLEAWAALLTDLDLDALRRRHPMMQKKAVAFEIVRQLHGDAAAREAGREFERVIQGGACSR